MERNKRSIKFLITYFIVFFILCPCIPYADEVSVGDQAKNLSVLPPWTMRLCPTTFYATYNIDEAKKLKETDAACLLWRTKTALLETQSIHYIALVDDLYGIIDTYKEEQKEDIQHIKTLTEQLNKEIAEKNKYKYQPNYNGLYIAIGAAIALVGISFGVGVMIAKK